VEDFFRGTRVLSKFTVSTTSHQHVRIASVEVGREEISLNGVEIVGCLASKRGVVTVTPLQPANFIFFIDSIEGPVKESLSLVVTYRLLREEVESLVGQTVQAVVTESPSWFTYHTALVNTIVAVLEKTASWVDVFEVTGELNVPGEDPEGELIEPLQRVKEVLRAHRHSYPPQGNWRKIKIPVDVPRMNIVAAARILCNPFTMTDSITNLPPLFAGQPISAILTVTTSFHWKNSNNDSNCRYELQFDVEEMVKDWLVSGRKRGNFSVTDGSTFTVPITLIALHHGELALPKVAVTPLPLAGALMMGPLPPSIDTYQVHGAEKILILPRGGRSTFVVGMDEGADSSH